MKLLTAIIQPEKLSEVKDALAEAGIAKMTVSPVSGCGQQGGWTETYRGTVEEVNLIKKVKIEVFLNNEYVDKAVQTIVKAARTGKIGDGKIIVRTIDQCIRIRTGEDGESAIG
ncbi:MAG: P-II family nitrogen regulator [Fibrobacterales bacterium]